MVTSLKGNQRINRCIIVQQKQTQTYELSDPTMIELTRLSNYSVVSNATFSTSDSIGNHYTLQTYIAFKTSKTVCNIATSTITSTIIAKQI